MGIVYRLVTGELSLLVLAALMVGPLIRAAYHIWSGTPLAVIGVRRVSTVGQPAPTFILGAHLDSASIPLRGSFLTMNLVAILYVTGLLAVGELISPVAAVWAAALSSALVFGNASPGGDDNASGMFAVLDCIARLGGIPDLNVVAVLFNFEEQGLLGQPRFSDVFWQGKVPASPAWRSTPRERIFVSGDKSLSTVILNTPAAKELRAAATSLYTSDHLVFEARGSLFLLRGPIAIGCSTSRGCTPGPTFRKK